MYVFTCIFDEYLCQLILMHINKVDVNNHSRRIYRLGYIAEYGWVVLRGPPLPSLQPRY